MTMGLFNTSSVAHVHTPLEPKGFSMLGSLNLLLSCRALPLLALILALVQAVTSDSALAEAGARPNVVLVITDDQGYGDLGAHGNSMIKTPNLDQLHGESIRLTDFHVDPTCSPTRSALMSGHYSTRTGVWHTIMGRSLMDTRQFTVAEMYSKAGYQTGMFGKWHLGDNFPLRPQDQGFADVFCHKGGGVGQGPDFWENNYFDDTYFRNGTPEKVSGYCTDVWFDNALNFIERNRAKPFFAYISTNAPHGPYLVDPKYSEPYRNQAVPETMAKFYGMITNIDENVGRLVQALDQWKLADNTILIFMSDNGTAAGVGRNSKVWHGFNAGMRGTKGSEYDGGHRVPFFIRWPDGKLTGPRDIDQLTAHVDVMPTLADLCQIPLSADLKLDGTSLAEPLRSKSARLPERTLFVHSQRIAHPEKWRKSAVMTKRWRLVNGQELFDMVADPGQEKNVADAHADVVSQLRQQYDRWWQSLTPVFDEYVRIGLGSDQETTSTLHCHDWHVIDQAQSPWSQGHVRKGTLGSGPWAVEVMKPGKYEIELRRWPREAAGSLEATNAQLEIAGQTVSKKVPEAAESVSFVLQLPAGPTTLQSRLTLPNGDQRGAYYAYVRLLKGSDSTDAQ